MKTFFKASVLPGLLAVAAFGAVGCTVTTYKSPAGAEFSRMSLGTKQAITGLEVRINPETGEQSLVVKSYSNDQAEVAAAVVQAAVQAAAKAVKP